MPDIQRVAVVTGGASGIGEAASIFLARDGASVAIWDMNLDAAEKVAKNINNNGGTAIACKVNVADRSNVNEAVAAVHEKLGPVGIIVNNAGINGLSPFQDIDDEAWDLQMNVNLKGTFICTQSVVGDMIDAGWGRIINISSSSAQGGSAQMAHYAASKGGVIAFSKALALELGPKGITVNNVPPGFVDTPMLRDLEKTGRIHGGVDNIATTIPMRRPGLPEDMAAAIAFLASESAGYITGLTLGVNGGRYIT